MLTLLTAVLAWTAAPQEPEPPGPERPVVQGLDLRSIGESGFRARFEPVDGVSDVSLWLGVAVGSAHDPLGASGLACVVAEVLRGELPPASEFTPREVVVLPGATLVAVTVRRVDAEAEFERFTRWLSGVLRADDDAVLRARGRALLRADDELDVLPGPLLRSRARRTLFAGTPAARPPAGVPSEIRAIEPERVRARFRDTWRAGRAFLVALGACDDELRELASTSFGSLPADLEPLSVPVPDAGDPPEAETQHERVAAPFVVLALPAPRWGQAGYLPFLVAIEVARTRAAHTFATLRGGELRAEFPPIEYDIGAMPSLAFIERRGRDEDDVPRVRAEIESFAAGLVSAGATPGEIRTAMLSLLSRVHLPPFRGGERDAMRRYPVFLHQRAGMLALYVVNGWPEDLAASLGAVPVTHVQKCLREAFAADRGRFFALWPEPRETAVPPGDAEPR